MFRWQTTQYWHLQPSLCTYYNNLQIICVKKTKTKSSSYHLRSFLELKNINNWDVTLILLVILAKKTWETDTQIRHNDPPLIVKVVSMPAWIWSVTWQWSNHVPGLPASISTVWKVPGNRSKTSARCTRSIWHALEQWTMQERGKEKRGEETWE